MKDVGNRLPNIGGILRTMLIFAAIFFIVIFTLVWFGIIAGVTFSAPFLTNFFPGKEGLTIIMMINLLFVIGIPLVTIIITIIRLVWKRRMGRAWKTTLGILWLVNGVSLVAIGGTLVQDFVTEGEIQQILPLDNETETFDLSYYMPDHYDNDVRYLGGERIELPGAPIRYSIKKSDDQSWKLNQITSSRGKNGGEARDLAWAVELPLKISKGSISSPKEIPFSELSKWRDQEIRLELSVPVGKFVRLGSDIRAHSSRISVDVRPRGEEHLYQMMESGQLVCQDCTTSSSSKTESESDHSTTSSSSVLEQSPDIKNFDKIHLSGPMKVTIEYGESYQLRIVGNEQDLEQMKNIQENNELNLFLETEETEAPVRVFITTPSLAKLTLESTNDVLLRGFNLSELDIEANGDFQLKADINIEALSLEAKDGVEVEFTGQAQLITAELNDASRLDTDRGSVENISLELKNGSKVKIGKDVNIIDQNIDDDSRLRIKN